jgi:hypothetical protein
MLCMFRPCDEVIWLRAAGGGFVFPVLATVVRVTSQRVTITADDPDERGEGIVTRHIKPSSLQLRQRASEPPAGAVTRKVLRRQ